MIIVDYEKKYHQKIINACVAALKQGKVVVFPTDTSYGLAVDATNTKAIKNLYKIKGRGFNKPSSVVVPSVAYAKKIVKWNFGATKLTKKFWPGALTLVLLLKIKDKGLRTLTSKTGLIGLRMPKNNIALDLAKHLKRPITATSANLSGKPDCYSAEDIIAQFTKKKLKPDIIISAGRLPKRQPSTVIKIDGEQVEILRKGPILLQQITKALSTKH